MTASLERLDLRRGGRAKRRPRGWGRRPRTARWCDRIGASPRARASSAWPGPRPRPLDRASSRVGRPPLRAPARAGHRDPSSGCAKASQALAARDHPRDRLAPAPSAGGSSAEPSSRGRMAFEGARARRCSTIPREAGSSGGAPSAAPSWAPEPPPPRLRGGAPPIDAAPARDRARTRSTSRSPSGSTDRTVRRRCRSPCEPRPSFFL